MVRIWKVPIDLLCKQHLVGLHNEIHKLEGEIKNERWDVIEGRLKENQITINVEELGKLHAQCVERLDNHNSPFKTDKFDLERYYLDPRDGAKDLLDLMERCEDCRENILKDIENE